MKSKLFLNIIMLFALFSSGCATTMWHNQGRSNMETTFGDRTTDYRGRVETGYFLGVEEHNGNKFYHFVVPDTFTHSEVSGIDVVLPLSPSDKMPKITGLDTYERKGRPVSVIFKTSIDSSYVPPAQIPQAQSPLDYPAQMIFALPYYDSSAYIKIAQPVATTSECREIVQTSINKPPGTTIRTDERLCERQHWSETYVTNSYNSKVFKSNPMRNLGYIVTVPIDIITSPFQLLFFAMMPKPRWGP